MRSTRERYYCFRGSNAKLLIPVTLPFVINIRSIVYVTSNMSSFVRSSLLKIKAAFALGEEV
jgi:hypothetical protein